jgi:hypothetical protein
MKYHLSINAIMRKGQLQKCQEETGLHSILAAVENLTCKLPNSCRELTWLGGM